MTILLALCAAIAFGASVALQERAASEVPRSYALRLGLLTRLAQRPIWLLGLGASGVGFLLQVGALRHGSLVVVQAIMTTTVIFALALVALWAREPLHAGEWVGVVAVVVGLVGYQFSAQPGVESRAHASAGAWWVSAVIAVLAVGLSALTALRRLGRSRAILLGIATGLSNAYVAVLTKAFAQDLHEGISVLRDWPFWGLLLAAIPAVLLVQSVYQDGMLRLSLPIIAIVEPFMASLAGVVLLHEQVHLDGARAVGFLVSALLIGAGVWRLARNPRLVETARPAPGSAHLPGPVGDLGMGLSTFDPRPEGHSGDGRR